MHCPYLQLPLDDPIFGDSGRLTPRNATSSRGQLGDADQLQLWRCARRVEEDLTAKHVSRARPRDQRRRDAHSAV
jgi:hypothetical protein